MKNTSNLIFDKMYKIWLSDIKTRVRKAQIKAAVKVNTEMLDFYWWLGGDIVEKQKESKWGEGLLLQLSKDLRAEFPQMKGFSRRNLEFVRRWYLFYSPLYIKGQQAVGLIVQQAVGQFGQQPVAQLAKQAVSQIKQIPWGQNIIIVSKSKDIKEALFYVQKTAIHNWSRSVLTHQIEKGLYKREGKSINNFALTLPDPQGDLAAQTLKDPYIFDFLTMSNDYDERDLENALTTHVTRFLLELGSGFAYLGRQIPLMVGNNEYFMDLLFYHTKLRCYVVIDLKTIEFEPEHAGKMNFYIKAVDSQLRTPHDQPTVGIIICKTKEKIVVEYSLSDIRKPIGVSEYQLTHSLPTKFKSTLPAIKEIEAELSRKGKRHAH